MSIRVFCEKIVNYLKIKYLCFCVDSNCFFEKRKNKKVFLFLSFLILFFPIISFAQEVTGDKIDSFEVREPSGDWFSNWVFQGVAYIFYAIFQFIGIIFSLTMQVLDFTISGKLFEKVFFSDESLQILNLSWSVVRDFLNLFFILILVFIAISIILNISKYNDKKLIFRVILAAVLVNFSKVITMVVIDVSQLIMNFFGQAINSLGASFVNVFSDRIGLEKVIGGFEFGSSMSFFVVMVVSIVFLFCITALLGFLTITLIIRLVAFWVLLILSPMAMFGLSLPGTAVGKMTTNWFSKLISWAFFGPLMIFFLWLALIVVSATSVATSNSDIFGGINGGIESSWQNLLGDLLTMIIPFISAFYLLYYGYDLSKNLSQGAAASILGWGGGKINSFSKAAWNKTGGHAIRGVGGAVKGISYGLTGASYSRAFAEGTKNRIKNSKIIKPFTKEEREKDYKKRIAKHSGGKKFQEYQRSVVNDKMEEIKKDGSLTDADVAGKMDTGTKEERAAAAMHLAKNGKLRSASDYMKAEEVINATSNESLKKKFEEHSKKKNSRGRYKSEIIKQKRIAENDPVNSGKTRKQIMDIAKTKANNKAIEEVKKKNMDDFLDMDEALLGRPDIFDSTSFTPVMIRDAIRKGNKNVSGKKFGVIKKQLARRDVDV